MALYWHQVQQHAQSFVTSIGKMPVRRKDDNPTLTYIENYNNLLALAMEVNREIDPRLWPKPLPIERDGDTVTAFAVTTYAEVETYARQIKSLLDPPPGPPMIVNDPPVFDAPWPYDRY